MCNFMIRRLKRENFCKVTKKSLNYKKIRR